MLRVNNTVPIHSRSGPGAQPASVPIPAVGCGGGVSPRRDGGTVGVALHGTTALRQSAGATCPCPAWVGSSGCAPPSVS